MWWLWRHPGEAASRTSVDCKQIDGPPRTSQVTAVRAGGGPRQRRNPPGLACGMWAQDCNNPILGRIPRAPGSQLLPQTPPSPASARTHLLGRTAYLSASWGSRRSDGPTRCEGHTTNTRPACVRGPGPGGAGSGGRRGVGGGTRSLEIQQAHDMGKGKVNTVRSSWPHPQEASPPHTHFPLLRPEVWTQGSAEP